MPARLLTLICTSCGAQLPLPLGQSHLTCAYCGQPHVVQHQGGAVFLTPILDGLRQVQTGVDRAAAELAIARLTQEIAQEEVLLAASPEAHWRDTYPVSRAETLTIIGTILLFILGIPMLGLVSNGVPLLVALSGPVAFVLCLLAAIFLFVRRLMCGGRAWRQLQAERRARIQDLQTRLLVYRQQVG